ncbi:MAG: BspA family leucine-rich repeat surface protein [Lachnospiraceae bacterium]|nr:BspA family leucine-rich repeat surface protein [Lachnospiraceae bacterium]
MRKGKNCKNGVYPGLSTRQLKNRPLFIRLMLTAAVLLFFLPKTLFAAPAAAYEVTVDTSYKSLGEPEGDEQEKISDTRFTSAIWHDLNVKFQGGEHYILAGIWDVPLQEYTATVGGQQVDAIDFSDTATYQLAINAGLSDGVYTQQELAKIEVWEYESKSYSTKEGKQVTYFERVKKAESAQVTAATGQNGGAITLAGINPEHPIAIVVDHSDEVVVADKTQSVMDSDGYKYDPYWHLYYTDGCVKAHNNFTLDYYNYEKSTETEGGQEVNYLTLTGYHEGLEDYVTAATAIADGHLKSSVISDIYGRSPIPEELEEEDYEIENWNIPASWTDPYDGITYKIRLGKNFENIQDSESVVTYFPVFPALTEHITVSTGVTLPGDARYLFRTLTGYQFGQGWEGSHGHGWVGLAGPPHYLASADDFLPLSSTITKSFAFVGDGTIGSNVTNMSHMFHFRSQTVGLADFDISKLDTSSATDMSYMFNVNLATGTSMKGLSSVNTSAATNLTRMFGITAIDGTDELVLTGENVAGLKTENATDMTEMFADSGFSEIDLSGFDFTNVTEMKRMFYRCLALEKVTFPSDMATIGVTDMTGLFQGCQSLSDIVNLNALDTNNVTTMAEMFGDYYFRTTASGMSTKVTFEYPGPCVETLDLSGFVTYNVEDMSGMFYLPLATSLDISGFDTQNVKNMSSMFYLPKVTQLDVRALNTGNVTNMAKMFDLASVKTLDVSDFNTSKVTDMTQMFKLDQAESLVFGLDTGNVVYMAGMFDLASVKSFSVAMDISSARELPGFILPKCTELKIKMNGSATAVDNGLYIEAQRLVVLDLSGSVMSPAVLSKNTFAEKLGSGNCESLVDLYLPSQLPTVSWNSIPLLPAESYIVGSQAGEGDMPATITDLSTVYGNMSQYAVLSNGGTAYEDAYSDRPVKPLEDTILIRAAKVSPVTDVTVKKAKLDENGSEVYEDDKPVYDDAAIEKITLYRYYNGEPQVQYPQSVRLYAVTVPEKAFPLPVIDWKVESDAEVFSYNTYSFSNTNYIELTADKDSGTAKVIMSATGYDAAGGQPATFTKEIPVEVKAVYWPTGFSVEKPVLQLKPGESAANPAKPIYRQNPDVEVFYKGVTYQSDNPAVATVDADGNVTAIAKGSARITAISDAPYTNKMTTFYDVFVTEQSSGNAKEPNWFYLTTDGKFGTDWVEGKTVAIAGSYDTLADFVKKASISYEDSTKTLTLNGFDEANLSILAQKITITLKGTNYIRGYGEPAYDGFVPEGAVTINAETGASLTALIEEYSLKNITLGTGVTSTKNDKGLYVFAGPAEAAGGNGGSGSSGTDTPQQGGTSQGGTTKEDTEAVKVGEKVQANDGTAAYEVTGTVKDATGQEVPTVAYTEPEGKAETAKKVEIPATVDIGNGKKAVVTEIAEGAFEKNTKVTTVVIGKNVRTIGKNAFKGCKKVTKVTVKGDALEVIGEGAFQNCNKLTSITFGKKVKQIGKNAFNGAKKLKTLRFKGSIKKSKIGKGAFKNIYKKATVYIPKTLSKKQQNTFKKALKNKGGMPKSVKFKTK